MARGRTNPALVTRIGADGRRSRGPDTLLVEEAMEVHLDGHHVATTMRTPGHDYELAVGFLFAEGLLAGHPVSEVRYCATGPAVDTGFNIVSVSTGGKAPTPPPAPAPASASAGTALEPPPQPGPAMDFDLEAALAAAAHVRAARALQARTRSAHAAAAFDPVSGAVLVLREDAGRRNAVDKVVGRLHLDRALPANGAALLVTGHLSESIVRKAWAAGFGVVVAEGGPTAAAVATAHRAGLRLAGFLADDGSATLYT